MHKKLIYLQITFKKLTISHQYIAWKISTLKYSLFENFPTYDFRWHPNDVDFESNANHYFPSILMHIFIFISRIIIDFYLYNIHIWPVLIHSPFFSFQVYFLHINAKFDVIFSNHLIWFSWEHLIRLMHSKWFARQLNVGMKIKKESHVRLNWMKYFGEYILSK